MSESLLGLEWHTEKRRVSQLGSWDKNPRGLTDKEQVDLKTSLERFNLMSIPVINIDNMLISGHQRIKILQLIGRGEEEIEVRVPNRALTPEEHSEANIRENKNTGHWDFEKLAADFPADSLKAWGFEDKDFGKAKEPQYEAGGEGEQPGGYGDGAEPSHVKMVQLFLTTDTHPEFMRCIGILQKKYGTDNITDTVFKTVQEFANAQPQGTEAPV